MSSNEVTRKGRAKPFRTSYNTGSKDAVDHSARTREIRMESWDKRQSTEDLTLFRTIFEASPAPIAITRIDDGTFVDINERFCTLVGLSRVEIKDRALRMADLWASTDRYDTLTELMAQETSIRDFEGVLRRSDGSERTTIGSFQRIVVAGSACLLSVLVDITERKKAERELIHARDRAEQMARVKTAFLANMTHEVRTPLTVILGFTSILRQGVPRDQVRLVRAMERSGRRLMLMLDSILDLAQLEAGTLEVDHDPFRLGDLLENAVEQVRPLAEEKRLAINLFMDNPDVYIARGHRIVARSLNNILDNAVKFTDEGRIDVGVKRLDGHVSIDISDTGIGMDQSFLPHVYEEFVQESTGLERNYQGSGLGLTVSRRLLRCIGGEIHVLSNRGTGSKVTITLPVSTNPINAMLAHR